MEGPGLEASLAVPPCDLDSEGIALSHALEHGPIVGLLPKHFYSDANRRIYEALTACSLAGALDTVLVCAELRRNDRLEQSGGVGYIATLAHCQPVTAYPERHAEVIRELWRRRVLCDAMERMRVELRLGQLESGEAWGRFKALCDELSADA